MKLNVKKTLRITSAVFACTLVAATVSGCSLFPSKSKAPVLPKVITIWGFEDEDLWQATLKDSDFKKITAGYTVNYVKKSLSDTYENDALNSITSGDGPDVWEIPNDWVYRHKDQLAPMPSTLLTGDFAKQYVPSLVETSVIDNNVYSYSPSVDTLMLYYNQKILNQVSADYTNTSQPKRLPVESTADYNARADVKQYNENLKLINDPPLSWSDLDAVSKLITKKDGNDITLSGLALGSTNNVVNGADIVYALMLQNNVRMISDSKDLATFNLPTSTAAGSSEYLGKYALEYFTKFANPSSPYYSWNSFLPNNLDAFAQSKAAYVIATGSASAYLKQKYPDFVFKTALLPQVDEKSDTKINYAKFSTFVVPKISSFSALAWQIALKAPFDQNTFATSKISPNYKDNPDNVKNFQANTSHMWIKGRYPQEVDSIFKTALDNLTGSKQNSLDAVNTAATQVTDLLRKQGW